MTKCNLGRVVKKSRPMVVMLGGVSGVAKGSVEQDPRTDISLRYAKSRRRNYSRRLLVIGVSYDIPNDCNVGSSIDAVS
jgi:hypothetical protein